MVFVGVPAKLMILAFKVSLAYLVFTPYFGARSGKWPIRILPTVQTYIAIRIASTRLVLEAAKTHVLSDVAQL